MSRAAPRRWAELAAIAAAGALLSVPLAHTALWPLALACIAVLYGGVSRAGVRRAALLGAVFGSCWLGASVWWLFISMHRYGGLFAPLAALAVLLLSVALSLLLAAAMALFARLRRGAAGLDALLFAGCWLLAELARGVVFTGFPWGATGYTQIDGPLAVLAPWVGVYGIGAVAAWIAAAGAGALGRRVGFSPPSDGGLKPTLQAAAAVVLLIALWLAPPVEFTSSSGRLRVALLQTNVAQDEKFAAEQLPQELAWVAGRLFESSAELIVTPETAVPLLPGQLEQFDPGYWPSLAARFRDGGQAALVGVPLGDFEHGYTNSVIGLSQAGEYRYDKHHLVPFGEFIPLGFHWFVELMRIPLGDFGRGPLVAPPFAVKGQRVTPNICYEDLFGEELAALFADERRAPTVLANVSNIAWFGDTVAVGQHLNISRMRALELQRPMLRATNTGATAIVDHRGHVAAMLPPFTQGVLEGEVEGRSGLTPFARWAARLGLWPLVLAALLLVAAAFLGKRP
ncbi:MAG TPA: apolipoprotein N-acyltransferase [Burkholderiaceae bacterium]